MIRILLTCGDAVNKIRSQEDRKRMYVCLCHGITEDQIRNCVLEGARTLCDLRGQLGVATQCGACESQACQVLHEALQKGIVGASGHNGRELTAAGHL
jgi:bacterioferritin-associated ferredoxin